MSAVRVHMSLKIIDIIIADSAGRVNVRTLENYTK